MKTKKLGWKKPHGIENIAVEDSQWNIMVYQRQVMKICENCLTESTFNRIGQTTQKSNLKMKQTHMKKSLYFAKWSGKICEADEGKEDYWKC